MRRNEDWLNHTPSRDYIDDSDEHKLGKPPFYTRLFVWSERMKHWAPAVRVVSF